MTLRAIVDGLAGWFCSHGYDMAQPSVKATLCRWTAMLEGEEFAISPPGRLRFFQHLLETNRNYSFVMGRRLRLTNHLNAVGSLVGTSIFIGWMSPENGRLGWCETELARDPLGEKFLSTASVFARSGAPLLALLRGEPAFGDERHHH